MQFLKAQIECNNFQTSKGKFEKKQTKAREIKQNPTQFKRRHEMEMKTHTQ